MFEALKGRLVHEVTLLTHIIEKEGTFFERVNTAKWSDSLDTSEGFAGLEHPLSARLARAERDLRQIFGCKDAEGQRKLLDRMFGQVRFRPRASIRQVQYEPLMLLKGGQENFDARNEYENQWRGKLKKRELFQDAFHAAVATGTWGRWMDAATSRVTLPTRTHSGPTSCLAVTWINEDHHDCHSNDYGSNLLPETDHSPASNESYGYGDHSGYQHIDQDHSHQPMYPVPLLLSSQAIRIPNPAQMCDD
jgi:hypothetical protein